MSHWTLPLEHREPEPKKFSFWTSWKPDSISFILVHQYILANIHSPLPPPPTPPTQPSAPILKCLNVWFIMDLPSMTLSLPCSLGKYSLHTHWVPGSPQQRPGGPRPRRGEVVTVWPGCLMPQPGPQSERPTCWEVSHLKKSEMKPIWPGKKQKTSQVAKVTNETGRQGKCELRGAGAGGGPAEGARTD